MAFPFAVDMKSLSVKERNVNFVLYLPDSIKRGKVYDSNGVWVGTVPKRVEIEQTILKNLLPLLPVHPAKESFDMGDGDDSVDDNDSHQ